MKGTGCWTVTEDHTGETGVGINLAGGAGAVVGPRGCTMTSSEIIQHDLAREFQMWDDDGNLMYSGWCIEAEGGMGEEGFAPLDDFGTPNAGATEIRYKNEKGQFEPL